MPYAGFQSSSYQLKRPRVPALTVDVSVQKLAVHARHLEDSIVRTRLCCCCPYLYLSNLNCLPICHHHFFLMVFHHSSCYLLSSPTLCSTSCPTMAITTH